MYSQYPSKCKAPFLQTTFKMQPVSLSELFIMGKCKSASRNGKPVKLRKRKVILDGRDLNKIYIYIYIYIYNRP